MVNPTIIDNAVMNMLTEHAARNGAKVVSLSRIWPTTPTYIATIFRSGAVFKSTIVAIPMPTGVGMVEVGDIYPTNGPASV